LVDRQPRLPTLVSLATLAGLPAVAGIWLGSYAFAPHWAALAFAVGAGAILQVVVEVGLLLARRGARPEGRGAATATAASGVVAGVVVMYATALLVQV
jgi:zinc transporter, ZIP family